jgi:hypothetical protein
MADQADRYALYLRCVQEPSCEVEFFDRVYRAEFGRKPMVLREDFCGTAAICYEWVRGRRGRRAVGVDLDPEPLAWGVENLGATLTNEEQRRVILLREDVRHISPRKADVIAAQNFSFWVFKTRRQLGDYFRAALRNLEDRGVFVLDMAGGHATMKTGTETRRKHRFRYIWDQAAFDPVTHDYLCHIHFRFDDGSELQRAFTYDWRMWTIPEVREVLLESGFDRADVYWEDTDRSTGEGNGHYRRRERGTSDPAWVAYVVGVKR